MKARLKISAHQDKLIIELPNAAAISLGLQEGDEVEVDIIRAAPPPASDRQALAALRKYRGRLPSNFKFDRQDANGR